MSPRLCRGLAAVGFAEAPAEGPATDDAATPASAPAGSAAAALVESDESATTDMRERGRLYILVSICTPRT